LQRLGEVGLGEHRMAADATGSRGVGLLANGLERLRGAGSIADAELFDSLRDGIVNAAVGAIGLGLDAFASGQADG